MKALVIVTRGFHLGYLGCYGNQWISTPGIDRLAAQGVAFDQHFAAVPEADAVRRAWRTGSSPVPSDHAAPVSSGADLLELLRAHGVRTKLILDGAAGPSEFDRGWAHVDRCDGLEATLEAARSTLEELAETDNWLLWIELASLVPPWKVPAEFLDPYFVPEPGDEEDEELEADWSAAGSAEQASGESSDDDPLQPWLDPPHGFIETSDDIDFARLQSTYAGAVSYVDAGVGVLLEELEKLPLLDDCLLVLTGDHGQALGEHGIAGPYRPWLHDELVHVPLIVRWLSEPERQRRTVAGAQAPTLAPGSPVLRVSALTQSADLMPTLLEAFGVSVPPDLHGQSLLPLLRGDKETIRDRLYCGLRMGEALEWRLQTAEWAFVLPVWPTAYDPPRSEQLYVKPDDRWEVNNVAQHHPELVEEFSKILREGATQGESSDGNR